MNNPTRRNRNIGTSKQGHGQNNRLVIPRVGNQYFYERLGKYRQEFRYINELEFRFVIEETSKNCLHACSVNDVQHILQHLPSKYLENLNLIIFRQPKRKEQIISSVWGRLIYAYEFEGNSYPAIILEAIDYSKPFKRSKKLKLDDQQELERLVEDGHPVKEGKRYFTFEYEEEFVRNTQLYRTLLHEIGHYAHYFEFVEEEGDDDLEEWLKRSDAYFNLPAIEKENYAHRFAEKQKQLLETKGIIPFEKKED